jgi:hypothetical protein
MEEWKDGRLEGWKIGRVGMEGLRPRGGHRSGPNLVLSFVIPASSVGPALFD